ncbi:MAG: helix-turn-helix domain-containing protein [Rhizobium sp.]|jgi:transcriptional regulator GlxA family with amidase domain|uniref:helix-turn-helix domain-containing protein n=1 Tax=Rhizobium sp. TaxID=391 RepID=UPI0006908E2A
MAFARRVRLTQARDMLAAPASGTTVTSVAFDCGFGNLGAFARYYQTSYGELPSATLRMALSNRVGNNIDSSRSPTAKQLEASSLQE